MLLNQDLIDLLDYFFAGGTAPPPLPAEMHVALHVGGSPPDMDTGLGFVEPTASEYGRQAVTNSSFWSSTTIAGSGPHAGFPVKESLATVEYALAQEEWGTPTHVGLFDAATGGVLRVVGLVSQSILIGPGVQVRFPAGAMVLAAKGLA